MNDHKPVVARPVVRHPDQPTYPLLNGVPTALPDSPRESVAVLQRLPYQEYLRSAHWQKLREDRILRSGRQCKLCEATDRRLDVHHKTYERLGRELWDDLIVLCEVCHAFVHGRKPPNLAILTPAEDAHMLEMFARRAAADE